jgi:hypothetical protein
MVVVASATTTTSQATDSAIVGEARVLTWVDGPEEEVRVARCGVEPQPGEELSYDKSPRQPPTHGTCQWLVPREENSQLPQRGEVWEPRGTSHWQEAARAVVLGGTPRPVRPRERAVHGGTVRRDRHQLSAPPRRRDRGRTFSCLKARESHSSQSSRLSVAMPAGTTHSGSCGHAPVRR